MAKKKKQANPLKNGMSPQEAAHAEEYLYYLQCGNETIEYNGKQTFIKDKAEYLFWELLESMSHMRKHGNQDDRRSAYQGLINFKIHKLRLH